MNETEFTRRVLAVSRKLYCVAYSILWNDADCMDAVQEATARAWQHRDRLREAEFFETWLVRILINECKSQLRKRKLREAEISESAMELTLNLPRDIDLRDALKKLPEKYRLPLVMHYQDGYSLKEISGILKIKESLVKSRLHQARGELKKLLGGDYYEA